MQLAIQQLYIHIVITQLLLTQHTYKNFCNNIVVHYIYGCNYTVITVSLCIWQQFKKYIMWYTQMNLSCIHKRTTTHSQLNIYVMCSEQIANGLQHCQPRHVAHNTNMKRIVIQVTLAMHNHKQGKMLSMLPSRIIM